MKAKSFFKGPGIWIVVVIGMLLLAFATLSPGGAARIDTDKGLALLTDAAARLNRQRSSTRKTAWTWS